LKPSDVFAFLDEYSDDNVELRTLFKDEIEVRMNASRLKAERIQLEKITDAAKVINMKLFAVNISSTVHLDIEYWDIILHEYIIDRYIKGYGPNPRAIIWATFKGTFVREEAREEIQKKVINVNIKDKINMQMK
jgi:hypothetical protein